MLAADYPFLDVMWTMLAFFLWIQTNSFTWWNDAFASYSWTTSGLPGRASHLRE